MGDFSLTSLRGGFDDETPVHQLDPDQMARALNVEIFHASCGERRQGMEALTMAGSSLDDETGLVFLGEHLPTGVLTNAELWGISATPGASVSVARFNTGAWNVVNPDVAITTTSPNIYTIQGQILNGKYFFAYPSAQDRLHVWDGTNLRPAGLSQPGAAPTAADDGGAGTFAGTRYYRTREVIKSGSTVLVRSEPSSALTFAPLGTRIGVTVTKPATANTRATHWELEASQDNANFYRIASTAIGTTTFDDQNASGTYPTVGTLSDAIGAYGLQPSARYLSVDEGRLLWFGHYTDDTKKSQFGWSVVNSAPGAGNDERLPIVDIGGTAVANVRNVDPTVGGEGTGISAAVNGAGYLFKLAGIYRYSRTLDETLAYTVDRITGEIGALPGSVVDGVDELGRACVYFIDPQTGPWRIGLFGLQRIKGLKTTWRRANTFASKVIARGVYYPDKQQVIWVFAADTNDSPTMGIRLQVTEVRSEAGICRRGWTLFDGDIAKAYALCTLHEVVTGDPTSLSKSLRARPFGGYVSPNFIQRWDTGTTDNGTAFKAWIRTKPFFLGGLLQKFGASMASLLAASNATFSLVVNILVDLGRDVSNQSVTTNLLPEGNEPVTVKDLDALVASEARSITIEFKDL
jgi:hypothetical protein